MKEPIDYLSTLFVGIDIASRIHVISALDFHQEFFIKMKQAPNSQEGAEKAVDKAILQTVQGLNPEEYTMLNSIPGIGRVYSAGILAELGSIKSFQNANAFYWLSGFVTPPGIKIF